MSDIAGFLHKVSIYAVPVLMAITFHEAAHGYVAYKKGDPTAFMLGRVTLNPLRHIDPVGTIVLPLAMLLMGTGMVFGWAKPVPVNFRLLRNQKWDPIYVAAAGVVTNLGLAVIAGVLFRLILLGDPDILLAVMGKEPGGDSVSRLVTVPLAHMCIVFIHFNVLLAVFNMIPIPPLDGGRIAVGLLPYRASTALASVERYGMLIVIALLMFGPLGIIGGLVQWLSSFILGI
ncbi:MAG: site-2 protease family protein [Syntrophorhabdaceae bacterium]|nr:site-2 protease family protein [Syntrophorhabdaceae bacterium]